jgi:hypothetical protein
VLRWVAEGMAPIFPYNKWRVHQRSQFVKDPEGIKVSVVIAYHVRIVHVGPSNADSR